MSSVSWRTHAVEPSGRKVTKQFSAGERGRCAREWRGLTLLARYAPGLAPVPRRAELTAGRPLVVMSRLPGVALRGRPLDERRLDALAEAVRTLHCAVPSEVVRSLPLRPGHQQDLVARLRSWASARPGPPHGGEVARAAERGLLWLAGSGLDAGGTAGARPVFGAGDGNLANYLWDGERVRVVDFEDSGRSDRVLELAEITEHWPVGRTRRWTWRPSCTASTSPRRNASG
ncbi:phosphotransferase family protein [Streptomyces sp. NPDC059740]|uniref:phosphotransferase family protein n=1 Tax=Streptomyces sp. NPDC059740 TaxID=3346926 RepID=UPI003659B260